MKTRDPGSHVIGAMRRLATPWAIALDRADRVQAGRLGQGSLIDIACGSSLQLAAYCSVLGRPGVGIDMDPECIAASAKTMEKALDADLLEASSLLCGDCLRPDDLGLDPARRFALLHLDPGRPSDVQRHTLEEMTPDPLAALAAWWDRVSGAPAEKMAILDLSPRLSYQQCAELDSGLADGFSDVSRTWEWTSQGRGRVDRLSVWIAGAASPGKRARYVRIPPGGERSSKVLEAESVPWESDEPLGSGEQPEVGESISLIDPALLASGVERELIPADGDHRWVRRTGRRPLLVHPAESSWLSALGMLVRTAQVRELVDVDPEQSVEPLIEAGCRLDFNRLTLRLSMQPSLHPLRQRELDRGLPDEGSAGFVLRLPSGMLAICV